MFDNYAQQLGWFFEQLFQQPMYQCTTVPYSTFMEKIKFRNNISEVSKTKTSASYIDSGAIIFSFKTEHYFQNTY